MDINNLPGLPSGGIIAVIVAVVGFFAAKIGLQWYSANKSAKNEAQRLRDTAQRLHVEKLKEMDKDQEKDLEKIKELEKKEEEVKAEIENVINTAKEEIPLTQNNTIKETVETIGAIFKSLKGNK